MIELLRCTKLILVFNYSCSDHTQALSSGIFNIEADASGPPGHCQGSYRYGS